MHDPTGTLGIFDSGVGGLTVLRRVAERLPNESIIYLGDTARVPYGTKSADTVIRYAQGCAHVLLERGIKLLVVACNTASAFALETLQGELDIPVIGVIEPGAQQALRVTKTRRIGVIGTPSTIRSGAYQSALRALMPDADVQCQACPLFVPLAEEGWTEGAVPRQVADSYLGDFKRHAVDTVVLGCTHYPLLKGAIAEALGDGVSLVDSAEAVSDVVDAVLDERALRAPANAHAAHRYLVTDSPEQFARVGEHFLGCTIDCVEWVDF